MERFSCQLKHQVISLLILGIFLCLTSSGRAADFRRLKTGQKLPDFALSDLSGNTYSLDGINGHHTLIVFWNIPSVEMNRDYSLEELITVQDLVSEYSKLGLKTLAIYVPRSDDELEKQEIEKYNTIKEIFCSEIAMPIDKGLTVFNLFGVNATPSTILLDKSGQITFTMSSYPWSAEKALKAAVKSQLLEKKQASLIPSPTSSVASRSSFDTNQVKAKQSKFLTSWLFEPCCRTE